MHEDWHRYFRHYAKDCFIHFARETHWNYKDDLCMKGCAALFAQTGETVYRQAILECGTELTDAAGCLKYWVAEDHNLDTISFGKSLLVLYEQTRNYAYYQQALEVWKHLEKHPKVSTGNYWHKLIYPNQVWLDGLYMALPFSARCMELTGQEDYSSILAQFAAVREKLWNAEKSLYIHAWDESREAEWADPVTGQSPSFWLRAVGWYLMALTDCYEVLARHTAKAAQLIQLLQEALKGLFQYYDSASHMFLQLIDRADLEGNYPETSGSAMVAYALLKGERLGMLPKGTAVQGAEILEGIRQRYLKEEAGVLSLHGICASAGLGPGPDHRTDRDGTPGYYLSERQMVDNEHGAAACMLACAELLQAGL